MSEANGEAGDRSTRATHRRTRRGRAVRTRSLRLRAALLWTAAAAPIPVEEPGEQREARREPLSTGAQRALTEIFSMDPRSAARPIEPATPTGEPLRRVAEERASYLTAHDPQDGDEQA